ncbi:2-keto-3-deoxygluconate permease [Sedimentibacter sp. MB31-C6]|uniref:2-keto-3-deoxygluconate permease n=1 Tax=Sedimentibacter sp. MB31-C6 TaxID=3109366 RepID=UPI002DDCB179|nr:2-keto-3-deoxygluconate permease [Sedimentibacter sp. MB36-C1]WSI02913.1 2-keto-3-deoxygluconate permease [Sedimentibacter sp. MB36-C1]
MKILKNVQRVPGGIMVVPLLLGATINTFFPEVLNIGGFTTALFRDSASALIALFLLCNGAQINVRQAGSSLAKGFSLTLVKFILGAGIGWFIGTMWGIKGVLGISPVAVIAALTNSNGGLYAALASQYGDASDVGAISILSINDGPFFTMIALGASGLASIPFMSLVASVVPIIIGFILGNLDEDLREFLAKGTVICIPFFAFPLGAALNFGQIITAGGPGIILGLITTIITGIGGYLVLKLLKAKNPAVGAAIGTTAGNAVGTPEAIAAVDPSIAIIATAATVQVAASIIVTAICCPLFVAYLDKRANGRRKTV